MKSAPSLIDLLSDRAVLVALLVIGVTGITLGATTVAFYQDSDASTGNTIQGGTLDLSLDGKDSLSSSITITDGGPDDSATHTFAVANEGPLSADHVEVSMSLAENDPGSEPTDGDLTAALNASEAATLVEVTTYEYRNDAGSTIEDFTSSVTDTNGNGVVDLAEVVDQNSASDDLAPPQANHGNETKLVLELQVVNDDSGSFVSGANTDGSLTGTDEDFMADGVDVTITVTLNQDASQ